MDIVAKTVDRSKRYYDTDYPHEFPIGNYYVSTYGRVPSHADSDLKYKVEMSDYFKERFKLIWEFKAVKQGASYNVSEIYEDANKGTLVHVKYKAESKRNNTYGLPEEFLSSKSNSTVTLPSYASIGVFYTDRNALQTILDGISEYAIPSVSKSHISLVTSVRGGLDTIEQDIKPVDIQLDLNYGSKFLPVHNKIMDRLNEDNGKGIVLLHGIPGTGKTNYIRYLCGQLDKEIIFLPPFLAENISSPDFIPFLLDHRNSILVIEDAEKIVLDREGSSTSRQSVANLLNMTDGLLSDCLSIQIIATFNTSRELIDKALLRKGRLIAEWKFDKLSVEDANILMKHLGREETATADMSLAEIYNVDEEEYVVQQERKQIGFGR